MLKVVLRAASVLERTVNVFICLTQLGGLSIYVLFTATSLQQLHSQFDVYVYIILLFLPLVLLGLISNLRLLAPVSAVATVCEVITDQSQLSLTRSLRG